VGFIASTIRICVAMMICLPPRGTSPPHSSRHGPQHTQHTASTAATPRYPQGRRQTPADALTPLKRSMLTLFGGPRGIPREWRCSTRRAPSSRSADGDGRTTGLDEWMPGPSFGGEHRPCLSGIGALWDYVLRVCGGGGGCAGGGVPLGAVPALSWCGEVSLGGIQKRFTVVDSYVWCGGSQRAWRCSTRYAPSSLSVLFMYVCMSTRIQTPPHRGGRSRPDAAYLGDRASALIGLTPTLSDQLPVRVCSCALCICEPSVINIRRHQYTRTQTHSAMPKLQRVADTTNFTACPRAGTG